MAKVKKLHDAGGPSTQRGPVPDSAGGPARKEYGSERARTEFGACSVCRSALAANGHCVDCGAPGEEPEGLDDYNFSEPESSRPASGHRAHGAQTPTGDEGRVGPASASAEDSVPRMTLAELWAEGEDIHQGLTPARAQDLIDMITKVSEDRGEVRPPRLGWLQQVTDEAKPKT